MAQMFNTLQASLAIMMPMSLAQLMECYTSILRIQALLLLGMIIKFKQQFSVSRPVMSLIRLVQKSILLWC